MKKILVITLLIAFHIFLFSAPSSYAIVINGDFSGGLTGWTTEDMDINGNISSPSASISVSAGQAVIETQGYLSDISLISLYQPVTFSGLDSTLSFDIGFWKGDTDDQGGGLPDFVTASYLDDLDSGFDISFMSYDDAGIYNVNGSLTDLSGGWYRVTSDISGLAGRSGILFFDLFDDLDGYYSTAKTDNIFIEENPTAVPEPSTFLLTASCLIGLLFFRKRQIK